MLDVGRLQTRVPLKHAVRWGSTLMNEHDRDEADVSTPYYCDPPSTRSPDDWRSFLGHPLIAIVTMVVVSGTLLPLVSSLPGGRVLASAIVGGLALWSVLDLNLNPANPRRYEWSRFKRVAWSTFMALAFSLYVVIEFRR